MWLAVGPTAAITLLAIALLGPALGALLKHDASAQWTSLAGMYRPEPTEQARYLLALAAPLLLTGIGARLARDRLPLAPEARRRLTLATQWTVVGFLLRCLALQRTFTFIADAAPAHVRYFSTATLVAAAALAVAAVLAAVAPHAARLRARLVPVSRLRGGCATAVAVLFIALSVLPAVNSETTIGASSPSVAYHLSITADEAFAVLDGRSPLGDFAAQYGSLWPYLTAATMALFGGSITVLTLAMAAITAVSLLSAYGIARRLTPTASAALLLFLPLLATSLFMMRGPPDVRYSPVNWFGGFPLRLAGPLLLAWLVVRHLGGARPRAQWPVLGAAGLVALNTVDFGVPALGATLAALLWTMPQPRGPALRHLAVQAAIGLGAAYALVSILLLVRTGSPADVTLLFRYARLFAVDGYGMVPLQPLLGLGMAIFATFVAAIGAATLRVLRGDDDVALTGLLAWSGIFGLGAGAYYVGRSHPEVLVALFAAWALALMPLTLLALRRLAQRPPWHAAVPELACVAAFALMACSLAQTPTPWSEAERLGRSGPPAVYSLPEKPFVAANTSAGEPVALLTVLGHQIGAELDVVDVTPITGIDSLVSPRQLVDVVDMLRAEGGSKLFLDEPRAPPEVIGALTRLGFTRDVAEARGLAVWIAPPPQSAG